MARPFVWSRTMNATHILPKEPSACLMGALSKRPRKQESRSDFRRNTEMHSILQDVRYGLRMLAKNPGITLVAIFTLGLGIGANTATVSLSNTFLRKPVSFPEADRLGMVLNRAPGPQGKDWSCVSPADFLEWKKQAHSFAALAGYGWTDVNITGVGEPIKVQGFRVT